MATPRIDMVFTYVDGADPAHAARRAELRRALGDKGGEREVWYRGVGEITYAVRSALVAMPWLGTIHIVSDGQHPPVDAALIESGRVRIVDHGEIVPPQYLPVFASTIIESFLHRIPGLSDIWLYNNDDYFLGSAIAPEEFCEPAPGGVLRLRTVPALVRVAIRAASDSAPSFVPRANAYTAGIANSAALLRSRCALPWRDVVFPRHLTQVYRTATAQRLEEIFAGELHAARLRHFRSPDQLSWSTLAYSAECAWGGARQQKYRPLAALLAGDELFIDFGAIRSPSRLASAWERVRRSRAKFLCLNNIPQTEAVAFERVMAQRGEPRLN